MVRLRLSFVVVLVFLALLFCLFALRPRSVSAHECAPPIPPPVPGPPVPAPATPGSVLINEVLAAPGSTWNCSEQGTHSFSTDSWVELYNPGNQPLDLYSVFARFDSGPNTSVFRFPFGAAIGPHRFLVLFPDAKSRILLPGVTLRFLIGDTTIDQVALPALGADQSYARMPDGSNTWAITNSPTIDASNTPLQPTPTSSSNQGGAASGSGDYGSGTAHKSSTPSLVNGTQPGWSKLQLPTPVPASTATVNAPLTVSVPSSTTNSTSDTPHRILLTILVIALALMLLWCWRLFRPS